MQHRRLVERPEARGMPVCLMVLSLLCLLGARADSRETLSDGRQLTFREKSLAQMERALGRPVRTLQDAVNAAYAAHRKRGFRAKFLRRLLDVAAYAQARAWGFEIDEFIRRGRSKPFALSDLADHPLSRGSGRNGDSTVKPASTETAVPRPDAAAIAVGPRKPAPARPADDRRLSPRAIHGALDRLGATVRVIERGIDRVEWYGKNAWYRSDRVATHEAMVRMLAHLLDDSAAVLEVEASKVQLLSRASPNRGSRGESAVSSRVPIVSPRR